MNFRNVAKRLAAEMSGQNFLGGELVQVDERSCFDVIDPYSLQPIGKAPSTSADEVSYAVAVATGAFQSWTETAPLERSRQLLAAADALATRTEDIAALISLETGRPYSSETRPEVENAVRIFRYFAGLSLECKGEAFQYKQNVLAMTVREALGVVGAIVPWNVPAMMLCLKCGPALTAGNTVVVKPAEESPLSSTLMAKLIGDHLPAGVLNVVNGFGENTGRALASDPGIAKLSFTGSVEAGREIYEAAAKRIIPVTLELGGKSPIIVFPDVDIERAVKETIAGMRFSRQGQSCTSTTRILVHEDLRESFIELLIGTVSEMRVGDPLDDQTEIGTLVSVHQRSRVEEYLDYAKRNGQTIQRIDPKVASQPGKCYSPAYLVLDPPTESRIVQDEIFGPVATVHSWQTVNEAVELANSTAFGLSACILTDSLSKAMTVARAVRAGFVQINSSMVIQPGISFGGYGQSGLGREASLESMLNAYTQIKTILIDHEVTP